MKPVKWTGGAVASLVSGIVIAFIGLALFIGGLGLVIIHGATRDDDGYYTSGTERLATAANALAVEDIDLGSGVSSLPEDVLGRVRIRAERPAGQPVFVGIARDEDLDAYLRGVRTAKVTDLDPPEYEIRRGGAPRRPPGEASFWVASAEGRGRQAADWDVEGGHWSVVAMNADGSSGVVVEADVGAKVGWLLGVGIAALVGGLLAAGGGAALIALAVRLSRRQPAG